jgi:uncharacterized protein YdhG (YjbR/CyaY superfamily)
MTKEKPHIVYHNDGSIWAKGTMTEGVCDGYWEWFRKDGSRMRSGHFENGKQVGEWITYDQKGKVVKKTQMKSLSTDTAKESRAVDGYIATFPKKVQARLGKMRRAIHQAAPEAQESISYRMPVFKLDGKPLVYFAAFKAHIGFFPPAPVSFRKETARFAGPKGNLRFPFAEPLPFDLVKRIVKFKAKAMTAKAKKK